MRAIKSIVALALLTIAANAQDRLPVIKSTVSVISIQDGEALKKNYWNLAPEAKPDIYEADLIDGKPHKVTFITDACEELDSRLTFQPMRKSASGGKAEQVLTQTIGVPQ